MDVLQRQEEAGEKVLTHRSRQMGNSLDMQQLFVDDFHILSCPLAWTNIRKRLLHNKTAI